MNTKLLIFSTLLVCNLTFGQATLNQSAIGVQSFISNPIGPQFGTEIFRFRSGLVTQLDAGSSFTTNNSQWFAMGRLGGAGAGFNQTFYGLRFQQPNRSLLMGYTSSNTNNP